jgi:hypothetical protein
MSISLVLAPLQGSRSYYGSARVLLDTDSSNDCTTEVAVAKVMLAVLEEVLNDIQV